MPRAPYVYTIETSSGRLIAAFTVRHEAEGWWETTAPALRAGYRVFRVKDGSYGKHDYRVDITEDFARMVSGAGEGAA